MGERRQAPRQKSFLRGCVYFNRRRNAVDCLIRDISDEGARIIFSAAVSVPDLVDIYIPQKEQMLRARVQWRHGHEVGIAFPGRAGTVAIERPRELADRVAQLEADIAALRRAFKRLKGELSGRSDDEAA